jgi:hypothetical protein
MLAQKDVIKLHNMLALSHCCIVEDSGKRRTSNARARFGKRRIKPRSSKAKISRWIPDLERRSNASFISSNEGGTPDSLRRSWIKRSKSLCFFVSIQKPPNPHNQRLRYKGAVNVGATSTKQEQLISVLAAFFKSFLIILLILTPRASLAKIKHREPEMASKERGDTRQ